MSDGAFVCRLNPFRHGLHGKALALPAKCPVRPASIPVVVASDGFKVFRKKKSAPKPVSSAPQRRAQPAHGKGGKLASPSTRELNGARKPHVDLGEAERLQKVMSRFGVASRRQSEVLITEGRVKVNGSVVKDLGVRVNSRKDKIQVNGQTLKMQVRAVWIAVHKPRGFVCDAREDERGTIFDLVPKAKQRNLAPVGRIDEDASGLVIMTNEKGHIAKLSAPTNNHIKEWVVDVEGIMEETAAQLLRKGVKLKDERRVTLPANVEIKGSGRVVLGPKNRKMLTRVEVGVRESRHHQIRRMFEAVDLPVVSASRRCFGPVRLGSLKRADFRYLTPNEIKALTRGVGKGDEDA